MTPEEMKADGDWQCAFNEAFGRGYRRDYDGRDTENPIHGVVEVLATSPGENDGASWLAVCRMSDGRYLVLDAWCDYTGWD